MEKNRLFMCFLHYSHENFEEKNKMQEENKSKLALALAWLEYVRQPAS